MLAGGIGSRLYPASRKTRPKQFLPIGGDESLLAQTVERADFTDELVVSTRPKFADEIEAHAPKATVLVEPAGRDTGPALTYATHRIQDQYGDTGEPLVVIVLPSDHYVGDDSAFEKAMQRGAEVASETGHLVTFGIRPERPETGYGYIEHGPSRDAAGTEFHEVAKFHEKPDADTVREYVDAGYRWNSGMFAWTPERFLDAATDSPLGPLVAALDAGNPDSAFDAIDPISVDYAVLERAERVAVVDAAFAWDDLGTWDALDRVGSADDDGNVAIGANLTVGAADNVIVSDDKHVSLVGVSGLAVVAYDDRVLVVSKDDAQRVRELVSRLAERGEF